MRFVSLVFLLLVGACSSPEASPRDSAGGDAGSPLGSFSCEFSRGAGAGMGAGTLRYEFTRTAAGWSAHCEDGEHQSGGSQFSQQLVGQCEIGWTEPAALPQPAQQWVRAFKLTDDGYDPYLSTTLSVDGSVRDSGFAHVTEPRDADTGDCTLE